MKIRLPIRKPGSPLKRPPQLKLKASVARSRRAPVIEEEDFLEEPEPNMRLSHAFVVVLVLHVIAVAGVFAFNSIKARQADIFSAIKDDPAKVAAAAPSTTDPTTDPATANASSPSAPPDNTTDTPQPTTNGSSASHGPSASNGSGPASPASTPSAGAKTHEMQPGETLTKVASEYGVTVSELEKANNITDPTKIRAGTVLNIPPSTGAPTASKATATAVPAAAPTATTARDTGKTYVVVKGDNPVKIAKKLKVSQASLLSLNGITDPRKLQIGQKLKIPASTK